VALVSLSLLLSAAAETRATTPHNPEAAEGNASALVLIPGGTFVPLYADTEADKTFAALKNSDEPVQPSHPPVRVRSFSLARFPVTKAEYRDFVLAHPEWRRSAVKPIFADAGYLKSWASDTEFRGRPREPVTEVSWFAAKAYCKSLGERLPTIQEWEYAARASETKADATDDEAFLARILSWYARHDSTTPEVGAWKNVYGVYDMHGSIWEWVADFNSALITGESRGDAQGEKNLFCGGGALFASEKQKRNYAAFMRFAFRSSLEGRYTVSQLGFRCAQDAQDTQGEP
jgi:formylglycine-generating enzyme required for sulfatase activity